MQHERLRRPEGQSPGVSAHLVVVLSEHVEALVLVHELGNVEVGDLESEKLAFLGHENVVWLQVSVNDAVLVQVHHAAQQLSEEPPGNVL